MPTLIISNDFPPRIGGIESFVAGLCHLLDDDVIVLTSGNGRLGRDGDRAYDRRLRFPVIRSGRVLLPTPRVGRLAARLIARHQITRVLFGAAAPLALLAPRLRQAGAERIVALSHGHEIWWARIPIARSLLRRMADGVDVLGTISDFTTEAIARALPASARARTIRLPPPVDGRLFAPSWSDDPGHDQPSHDQPERPTCVAVGRFVRQKGFDTLLDAWRLVLAGPAAHLDPQLVLIGDGPQRDRLLRQGADLGSVRFTGALPQVEVAAELRRARLFALPVRTRWWGLNPEGLGLGFCEAAASGLPVLVGRSGGAPETVRHAVTGYLVEPDDPAGLAEHLGQLLGDAELARRMGAAGRHYVLARLGSEVVGRTLRRALGLPDRASAGVSADSPPNSGPGLENPELSR